VTPEHGRGGLRALFSRFGRAGREGRVAQYGSRRSIEAWKPYYAWAVALLLCLALALFLVPTTLSDYFLMERQLQQKEQLLQKLQRKMEERAKAAETPEARQNERFLQQLQNPVTPSQAANLLDQAFQQVHGAEQVSYRLLSPVEQDDYVLHPFQYSFKADVQQLYRLFQAVEAMDFPVVIQDMKVAAPRRDREDRLDVDLTIALVSLGGAEPGGQEGAQERAQ